MTDGRRRQAIEALAVGIENAKDVMRQLDEGSEDFGDMAGAAEYAQDQIGAAVEMLAECCDEEQYGGDDEATEAAQ